MACLRAACDLGQAEGGAPAAASAAETDQPQGADQRMAAQRWEAGQEGQQGFAEPAR